MPGSPVQAKKIVVISMLGTGAIVAVASFRKGQAPKPRSLLGLGIVYMGLAALADTAPQIAEPFSMLVLATTAFTEGAPVITSIGAASKSKSALGASDGTLRINTPQAKGVGNPAINTGGAIGRGDTHPSRQASVAVAFARSAIGVPYRFGGTTREGYDCSGLCLAAYLAAGKRIPRTSEQQWAAGYPRVPQGSWAPGDLIFSDWNDGQPSPGHVVMYSGNGQCIAAPHSGTTVKYQSVATFLGSHYVGSCRPAP